MRLGFLSLSALVVWAAIRPPVGVVYAQSDPRDAATRQYAAAVALQNREVFDLAADEWDKFLRQFPDDPRADRATHYLGVCHLKGNRFADAAEAFQKALKQFPQSTLRETSLLYLGIAQYSQGRDGKAEMFDQARATFDELLKSFPQGKSVAQALFYQGECLYGQGRKTEAAARYTQLLDKYPQHSLVSDALYALAVAQQEAGQHEAAAANLDRFLQQFSENSLVPEARLHRGEAAVALGQFEAAVEQFGKAAEAKDYALADLATVRQAVALAQLGRYGEAAELYESIPRRFPESKQVATAGLAAGKCYHLGGNHAKARAVLEALLKDPKQGAEAAHWIARSLLKENRPAEALAVVEKAMQARAKDPPAQLLLDQADAAYEIPDQRRKSVELYAALAAGHPQDAVAPQAAYMAGFAALGLGDYAGALKSSDDFLAQFPKHELVVEVKYVAAEARLQLGRVDEARKLYHELIDLAPQHADVETWRVREGLALFLKQKYAEAVVTLQGVVGQLKTPAAVAEAHYLIGASLAEQGQAEAAITALKAALAADPKWRQADATLLALAQAYRQNKQASEAAQCLRKLVADFSQSGQLDRAHYNLGAYAYADNDSKTAAAEYRTLLAKWPDSPLASQALYGLAWSELNLGHGEQAEEAVATLLKRFPQDKLVPGARYARGLVRHQQKRYAEAIEDLEALLATKPERTQRSDARYALALCQVGLAKWDEAVATLESILKDDAQYAGTDKVLYELAWAHKSRGKDSLAAEAFARLAEKHPQSALAAECHFHVGEAAYQQGEFLRAAKAYLLAIEKAGLSPLGEKAAHKLGWAYFRSEDYARAAEAFAAQRKQWPKGASFEDGTFLQAECLLKQEKYAEALKLYEAVGKPTGKDFGVLALLHGGQAAAQASQWEKSRKMLEEAVQRFADSDFLPEILYEQGWALQNLGQKEEALKVYEQVVAKTAREAAARAQFMIGEIQFAHQQHAEAVKSFFKVAYGYSYPKWQAEATYESGRCFEIMKMKSKAQRQYEELIQKFPKSDRAPAAREALERLKGAGGSGDEGSGMGRHAPS